MSYYILYFIGYSEIMINIDMAILIVYLSVVIIH